MKENVSGCFFSEHSVVGLPVLLGAKFFWLVGRLGLGAQSWVRIGLEVISMLAT